MKPAELIVASDSGATAFLTARRADGSIVGLSVPILHSMDQARFVAAEIGLRRIYATCGPDGKHRDGSDHYRGDAWDCRHRNMTLDQRALFVPRLQKWLGPDYLVLQERTHIHIAWRPQAQSEDPV